MMEREERKWKEEGRREKGRRDGRKERNEKKEMGKQWKDMSGGQCF